MVTAETRTNSSAGKLTIAIPAPEKQYWLSNIQDFGDIDLCTVEFDESGDLVLSYLTDSGDERPPVFFCIAYSDDRNQNFIKSLKENPVFHSYFSKSEIVKTATSPAHLLRDILASLSRYIDPLVQYSSDQVFALSALRREYERVHARFSALEAYIAQSGSRLLRERLFIAPERQRNGEYVFLEVGQSRLRQVLPVSSKGLSVIDVYVRMIPLGKSGNLKISAFIGDSLTPEARWSLPLSGKAMDEGRWRSLSFDRSLDGIPRSVTLEFEAEGLEGSPVLLGAGGLIANNAYCAQDVLEQQTSSNRPIAMRVWESPPGLTIPRAGNVMLSEPRTTAEIGTGRLPANSLVQFRCLPGANWNPDFDPVTFLEDEEALSVHPPDSGCGPTGAIIEDVVPGRALSVTTTAYVAHEASKTVEFAVAVADPAMSGAAPWAVAPQFSGVLSWSGWHAVEAGERRQVSVFLGSDPDAKDKKYALVFLTRMKNDEPNAFAWARFADVTVEEVF